MAVHINQSINPSMESVWRLPTFMQSVSDSFNCGNFSHLNCAIPANLTSRIQFVTPGSLQSSLASPSFRVPEFQSSLLTFVIAVNGVIVYRAVSPPASFIRHHLSVFYFFVGEEMQTNNYLKYLTSRATTKPFLVSLLVLLVAWYLVLMQCLL